MADLYNYRLLLLVKPDVPEASFKSTVEELTSQIIKDTGSVKEQDLWGLRDLAYKINTYDKGYYAHLRFIATPESVENVKQSLMVNESALRYLITRE